jgi:hypothetical protein
MRTMLGCSRRSRRQRLATASNSKHAIDQTLGRQLAMAYDKDENDEGLAPALACSGGHAYAAAWRGSLVGQQTVSNTTLSEKGWSNSVHS